MVMVGIPFAGGGQGALQGMWVFLTVPSFSAIQSYYLNIWK